MSQGKLSSLESELSNMGTPNTAVKTNQQGMSQMPTQSTIAQGGNTFGQPYPVAPSIPQNYSLNTAQNLSQTSPVQPMPEQSQMPTTDIIQPPPVTGTAGSDNPFNWLNDSVNTAG